MSARERESDHSHRGSGVARRGRHLQWCCFMRLRLHDCRTCEMPPPLCGPSRRSGSAAGWCAATPLPI